VATNGFLTVALDLQLNPELISEGTARDLVNRIQNLRKESGLDVGDRIQLGIFGPNEVVQAAQANYDYICTEVLAVDLQTSENPPAGQAVKVELEGELTAFIVIQKMN
jgi:isoleucyl-tRNA synthetase